MNTVAAESGKWDGPSATDNSDFFADMYGKLAVEKGNLFFSPYSIATALAMTSAGARGATDQQMAQVLHLNTDPGARHSECGAVLRSINEARGKKPGDGVEISTANAVWCAHNIRFKKEFLDVVQRAYRAEARGLDFAGQPDEAVKTINGWVEKETRDKIKNLIGRDAIGKDTAMVLTNAIYMKADWLKPFEKESTHDAEFTLGDGAKIKTATMAQTASFGYAKHDGFAALEMPYKGGRLSMLILLPDDVAVMAAFEKGLTAERIGSVVDSLKPQRVKLFVPRFHAETEYELSKLLKSMGMTLAFTEKADFTGITSEYPLFISLVIHKAFVDVDEKGTEAAAATAVVMRAGSAMRPEEPPTFRADHPFVYLIRDSKTGQILFGGRMADPRR